MPTIHVMLEIEGKAADAYHVVDSLLDAGFFQDAINDHDADAGDLHVTSAVCRLDVSDVSPCAASMGCLCAGHARGNPADAPCDTRERS